MKYSKIMASIILALGMSACSQNEEITSVSTEHKDLIPFQVTVTDGGYSTSVNGPSTRLVEQGYTTKFESGDVIGVFLKRPTLSGDYTYENIALTYDSESNNKWKGNLYYYSNEGEMTPEYTAYYPYNKDITDEASFNTYIENFTPVEDQSLYADYTKSDLMLGIGTIERGSVVGTEGPKPEYKITFNLKHKMALCVIKLPLVTYAIDDNYTFKRPLEEVGFGQYIPYCVDNSFRYLTKPNTELSLSGNYQLGEKTKEYTINISKLEPGSYKEYNVDKNSDLKLAYTLQIGDYFMADGSLVGKDQTLSDNDKKNCIGIVFQTDPNRISSMEKEKGWKHGYVMALKNALDGTCTWSDNSKDETDITNTVIQNPSQIYADIEGYKNNQYIIRTYGVSNGEENILLNNTPYQAFYHAAMFGRTESTISDAAPVGITSGWYLPSPGQWWDILENLAGLESLKDYKELPNIGKTISIEGGVETIQTNLQEKMNKVSDFEEIKGSWTSSENGSPKAPIISFKNGFLEIINLNKGSQSSVRCILSF